MPVNSELENIQDKSSLTLVSIMSILAAVAIGSLVAILLLPSWTPNLVKSLIGESPKAYWYLSRGAAFVALGLLWISMMLGLLITNKIARSWPGAPAAFALHEYVSLLGLAFALFHALILLGDHYINYRLVQILMPFGSVNYHPIWVGLGQIGLYVWAIISVSFYIRRGIGPKTWKLIHYASFFNFLIAVIHGLASGTDTSLPWAEGIYWFLGGSFLFLTVYRIVVTLVPQKTSAVQAKSTATLQNNRQLN
jgi:predicted ferric reductase